MKGPWDPPENSGDLIAYKEFREYRALNRRYHRNVRRQRLLRQLGLPMLALVGSFTVISGFMLFGPVQWPSFRSSPSLAQASIAPFAHAPTRARLGRLRSTEGSPAIPLTLMLMVMASPASGRGVTGCGSERDASTLAA
jgi:hypothetical protein